MKLAILFVVVFLCFAVNALAATTPDDVPTIDSEAQAQKHLEDMAQHDSPLLYLSDAGRNQFVDGLIWTESGIAGFSFFPLELELTEQQAYRVLQLFDLESFASSLNTLPDRFANSPQNEAFVANLYAFRELILSAETKEEDNQVSADFIEQQYHNLLLRHYESVEDFSERELHQLRSVLATGFTTRFAARYAAYYEATLDASSATPTRHHLQQLLHYLWVSRDFERLFSLANTFNLQDYVQDSYLLTRENKFDATDTRLTTMILREGEFTRENRDALLADDFQVVVVSSPGCGFSRALYHDFEKGAQSHPQLPARFNWFISQKSGATPAELFSFAQNYPSIDFEIVFFDDEWEEYLDLTQYPLIYVVADGEVRLAMTGWSAHNKISDLVELASDEHAD